CFIRHCISIVFTPVHYPCGHPRALHSFPTRRSSDLRPTWTSRSMTSLRGSSAGPCTGCSEAGDRPPCRATPGPSTSTTSTPRTRSEEHTSELQSRFDLVCRLLLEKKKNQQQHILRSI